MPKIPHCSFFGVDYSKNFTLHIFGVNYSKTPHFWISHGKLKISISHPPFLYDWEKIFMLTFSQTFCKKVAGHFWQPPIVNVQVRNVECSDILAEYCCIIQMVQCQTCMKYNPKVYQRSTKFNQEELPTLNIYKKSCWNIFLTN